MITVEQMRVLFRLIYEMLFVSDRKFWFSKQAHSLHSIISQHCHNRIVVLMTL